VADHCQPKVMHDEGNRTKQEGKTLNFLAGKLQDGGSRKAKCLAQAKHALRLRTFLCPRLCH